MLVEIPGQLVKVVLAVLAISNIEHGVEFFKSKVL
jgi:hypothetical protein